MKENLNFIMLCTGFHLGNDLGEGQIKVYESGRCCVFIAHSMGTVEAEIFATLLDCFWYILRY